ncbi:MAG: amidase [Candidatus Tectomicrobia bacterium]|jgi:aspartyl-tRNA(Asn)/glutamyl-tRNA(Gln) amidotransferase subunit A|nr:amidase [Candidatus Tectomicrobia bacterium]
MNTADIPFLSATALGELIRNREVSPVEATTAYLDRIEAIDGKLHSYITVCRDHAFQAAREAEQAIAQGKWRGPLHGVPYAVKDQFWTKGIRTTGGSRLLADSIPNEDATVVARLRAAGGILLGKLNMSEFATGNSVHHPFGTPHNPWDLERNPGTSSSGSGAATAAFLCATSLGEDTGGSIRNPANNCGLVGLRPTWGLVSRYGMMGACWSMDIGGPISRTVEDCALTLQAIAGHDPRDPYTANTPVPDYRAGLAGDIRGVRVGVVKEGLDADFVHPQVRAALSRAVADLKEQGVSVDEVSIPLLPSAAALTRAILAVESASLHHEWLRTRRHEYDHNVQIDFLTGAVMPAQLYYKAQKLRALVRQQVFDALRKVDVLATPSSSEPAPLLPQAPGLRSKEEARQRMSGRRSLTGVFNLANVPALSVPCGFVSIEGKELPVGLQLGGRPFEDGLLLKVAHAYEQATPWHTRRPPV